MTSEQRRAEPLSLPCQRTDPMTGGSCGKGPDSPTHGPKGSHWYIAKDRRNRDRRAEDDRDPSRHPNRSALASAPPDEGLDEVTDHAVDVLRELHGAPATPDPRVEQLEAALREVGALRPRPNLQGSPVNAYCAARDEAVDILRALLRSPQERSGE